MILKEKNDISIRQIEVSKGVQAELVQELERQAQDFLTYRQTSDDGEPASRAAVTDSERISFFPIYTLQDRTQIFEIPDYSIGQPLEAAVKSPDSVDDLKLDDSTIPFIKALCVVFPATKSLKIYFQAFERRRVLSTDGWTFLQSGNTFSRLERPGFTLGSQVHAIYDNGNLLFRSFPVASRFLDLVMLFNEASNEKVEEVLGHEVLRVANSSAVIDQADTVMRKQFAAISALKTLDKIKPAQAKKAAAELDIDLNITNYGGKMKIDFPVAKKEQKVVLKFLTEGYYLGPLTGTKFESNSHRPRTTKSN